MFNFSMLKLKPLEMHYYAVMKKLNYWAKSSTCNANYSTCIASHYTIQISQCDASVLHMCIHPNSYWWLCNYESVHMSANGYAHRAMVPRTYSKGWKRKFQDNQHTLTQFISHSSDAGAQSTSEPEQDFIPESPEFVELPEFFTIEENITDTAYSGTSSDTSSDAEATLFTTKDYSASHKKLLLAKDLMEEDSDETSEDDVNGYRLLDMSLLEKLVNTVSRPHCKVVGLFLEEDSSLRNGLCSFLMAVCRDCGNHIGFYTSQKKGSFMEVNRRSVLAAREIGCGRADLEMFCAMMNLPLPVTHKSFTGHVGAISDALKVRCNESMLKTRELVKRLENELDQEP